MADLEVLGSLFGDDFEDSSPQDNDVKRKVVFFPFAENCGGFVGEFPFPNRFQEQPQHNPVDSWRNIAATVYANSSHQKQEVAIGMLASINDTLYIVGQCLPGSDKLFSLSKQQNVEAGVVVNMLKYYLKKEFAGKVKVYACHSATDGTGAEPSFAKRFAQAMKLEGYTKCRYFGYNAQVSGFATQAHKGAANMKDTTGQHKWVLDGPNAGKRGKAARVEIPI